MVHVCNEALLKFTNLDLKHYKKKAKQYHDQAQQDADMFIY